MILALLVLGVPANLLITPGRGIGNTWIGDTEARVVARLGKPSYGDAAMGHFWSSWEKRGEILDIYTERSPNNPKVRLIRVTSPSFQTTKGVRTGAAKDAVLHKYPTARREKIFQVKGDRMVTELYDGRRDGIAFEFQNKRLVGITVHPLNHSVDAWYSPLSAYIADRRTISGVR